MTLIVIGLDLVGSALSLWNVHKSSSVILAYFAAASGGQVTNTRGQATKRSAFTSVALSVLGHPEELLQVSLLDGIRVDSSIAHSVSQLNLVVRRNLNTLRGAGRRPALLSVVETLTELRSAELCQAAAVAAVAVSKAQQEARLIRQALQMLFYWEYIECVIPLMYALYVSVAVTLPTAVYHQDLHEMVHRGVSGSMSSVVTYACLELLSFMLLSTILSRRFSFLPLFHLAFVLENQMALLQAKMTTFTLFVVQFQLDHLGACWQASRVVEQYHSIRLHCRSLCTGADFSFQFRRLQSPTPVT